MDETVASFVPSVCECVLVHQFVCDSYILGRTELLCMHVYFDPLE